MGKLYAFIARIARIDIDYYLNVFLKMFKEYS
jgi:hypothetical protein